MPLGACQDIAETGEAAVNVLLYVIYVLLYVLHILQALVLSGLFAEAVHPDGQAEEEKASRMIPMVMKVIWVLSVISILPLFFLHSLPNLRHQTVFFRP
jgi:hypothetical protein